MEHSGVNGLAEKSYGRLREKIIAAGRQYDIVKIDNAFAFANCAHQTQKRDLGGPFIMHPLATATLALELGLDTEALCAALLHDVVEDTPVTLDQIVHSFGGEVGQLVDGVTKLGRIGFSSREEEQAENLRKILQATAKDVRVIIIKLCDRLHNMRTAMGWKEQKRRDKALENMEVYAPIARKLGIAWIQRQLEALSLRYLDPVGYAEINRRMHQAQAARQCVEGIRARLRYWLDKNGCQHAIILMRPRNIYSIYRRVFEHSRYEFNSYSPYGLCIITDSLPACYAVQDIVNKVYPPLPGGRKDYIEKPKSNFYQSLHSTHCGSEGIVVQVQVRTLAMDQTAEFGVAACWKYGTQAQDVCLAERLAWVTGLLDSQRDVVDGGDLRHDIKRELAAKEIRVYTPKSDIVLLPAGATVIDFAYAIHSDVGNQMVGARVNGAPVSLKSQVHQGDVVNVITSRDATGPPREWMELAVTATARGKIRHWIKKNLRVENVAIGKGMLNQALSEEAISIPECEYESYMDAVARKCRINSVEEMYAALGYGGLHLSRLMPRIRDMQHGDM